MRMFGSMPGGDPDVRPIARATEFARISGVGARKLSEFGSLFMSEIARHLQEHPRQAFADDSLDVVAPPGR